MTVRYNTIYFHRSQPLFLFFYTFLAFTNKYPLTSIFLSPISFFLTPKLFLLDNSPYSFDKLYPIMVQVPSFIESYFMPFKINKFIPHFFNHDIKFSPEAHKARDFRYILQVLKALLFLI